MGKIKLNSIPYSIEPEAVISVLQSDGESGLSSSEVKKRLKEYGANKIEEEKNKSLWLIFLDQFKSRIVWLLVFAAGLSFYFGEWVDGIAILAVIFINALIGFYMEYQAERSMNSLKKLSAVPAKVLRNKKLEEINAEDVVPGDVVYIEAGDMIPADGRIFKASQMQIDESALTGESVPVEKQIEKLETDTTLAERNNTLYKGTYATKGNGYMVVTETGMETELGKIAQMVQTAEQAATPLEKKLEDFSKKLIWITVALVIVIFITGLLNGQKLLEMLQTSIALAVAAIPEGLPIVATMALAQGMMKMAKHNVIVKKLSAVETLGGTNVICTDKTGTLTQNKIEVNTIITPADNAEALEIINRIAVLCNTAELQNNSGAVKEIGDPLEIGLLKFALKNNFNIQDYRSQFPKIKEEPFSSETRIMATLHQSEKELTSYAKGATEELLMRCNRILKKEGITELNDEEKELWMQKAEDLANSGLKVILDTQRLKGKTIEEVRKNQREFQLGVLDMQIEQEREIAPHVQVFLDRAIPDALAYYRFLNLSIDDKLTDALRNVSYKKIFIMDSLPLKNDYARNENAEAQKKIHALITEVYESLPFPVVHVPVLPAEDRVDFILKNL